MNFSAFRHSIALVSGKYTSSDSSGEVSHFKALSTALSGTVGLGNIGGVAVAISLGGPGATFWMILSGLLGMSLKFCECTLGVKYRNINPDGSVSGGAMYYLTKGLSEKGMPILGKFLAYMFAIFCVFASLAFVSSAVFCAEEMTIDIEDISELLELSGVEDIKGWENYIKKTQPYKKKIRNHEEKKD